MTWPNSVATARPLPGFPSTFPGVPANDNWRMPRTNYRPPAPANDNFPKRSGGLRLPGVLRRLPVAALAFELGYLIINHVTEGPERWHFDGWERVQKCAAPEERLFAINWPGNSICGEQFQQLHYWDGGVRGTANAFATGTGQPYIGNLWRMTQAAQYRRLSPEVPDPYYAPDIVVVPRPVPVRVLQPQLAPRPVYYPGYYPPLMNPPFGAPPPLRPGRYRGPKQIMPEWPDSGYAPPGQVPPRRETYLPSGRPPGRTKERKVRAKDYAIGRTIEWLVSQSTEGLDFQRALFEALPWWRKIALYNAARQLETRYANGRIVAGRLHYRDLTPIEKAQAIYDYIDEIDAAKAVENAVKMQLTDMFWAEIGQRMGRYQTGPWDDHGFDGPPKPEPEWEWYIPDIAPDTTHNHWTYETLVNKRLTQQEAQRIHNRFDQFRSAPYNERNFR